MTKLLPEPLRQLMGQPVRGIDTPALVIDLDAMNRNLTRMADFAHKHEIRWRAHAKMHKSAALSKLQIQAGSSGVCVQKVAEAEALAAAGVNDIFITNEVVSPFKLARVAELAASLAQAQGQLSIAVDSVPGITRLAEALDQARKGSGKGPIVDTFVEVDVGQGRCGAAPGAPVLALVHEIRRHAALRFAGLQAYQGKAQHLRTVEERRQAVGVAAELVRATRKLLESKGIAVDRVTGGGTGSMVLDAASGAWDELQCGSFLFMDADYAKNEQDPAQPKFEHALFVKTQVTSRAKDHAVCDAGHKSHAVDSGLPLVHAFDGPSGMSYTGCSDEHGVLRSDAGRPLPELGATLWLIPGHCDPTVNLHDYLIGVGGGLREGVVKRILRVDARGALT